MKAMTVAVVALVAAVLAASALAGNSSSNGAYASKGSKVQGSIHTSKPSKKPVTKGATTLPFTGMDLAFVTGGGLLLVAMGVGLRRVTRRPPTA